MAFDLVVLKKNIKKRVLLGGRLYHNDSFTTTECFEKQYSFSKGSFRVTIVIHAEQLLDYATYSEQDKLAQPPHAIVEYRLHLLAT